jgi:hypothetical protein
MQKTIVTGYNPLAVQMAESLGLDTEHLYRFIFDVTAGEPMTVTAIYNHFVTEEGVKGVVQTLKTRRYHVVEMQ